jgi:hypothetical protein
MVGGGKVGQRVKAIAYPNFGTSLPKLPDVLHLPLYSLRTQLSDHGVWDVVQRLRLPLPLEATLAVCQVESTTVIFTVDSDSR